MSAERSYTCEACGAVKPLNYQPSGRYVPKICRPCHQAGYKSIIPITPRITTPWLMDDLGVLSRAVEGGA